MGMEINFSCPLPYGLHARPASMLAALVGQYQAHSILTNLRTQVSAQADSVLDLIALGVMQGDSCSLQISGEQEAAAYAALEHFIKRVLPACDAVEEGSQLQSSGKLPKVLEGAAVNCQCGTSASPGIGIGTLVHFRGVSFPASLPEQPNADAAYEEQQLRLALAKVLSHMQALTGLASSNAEADVSRATVAIINDRSFRDLLQKGIAAGQTAAQAVIAAILVTCERLEATGSMYLAERVIDVQDIGLQLLLALGVELQAPDVVSLSGPSVVAAQTMSPRKLLELDRSQLNGLILQQASQTAHVVIIARSLGLPVVSGVEEICALQTGQECLLDASRGIVLQPVTSAVRRFYNREQQNQTLRQARYTASLATPAQTADGLRIEIAANIASAAEAGIALKSGAEGIGLFRTEMLLVDRNAAPTEEEQFEAYRDAVQAMQGRPVIIRTFDIGGDKQIDYLNLPKEQNPFLGCRGIRLYEQLAELVRSQLRAILRSAQYGPVSVMAPMVATCEEALWFKQQVAAAAAELEAEGLVSGTEVPVGIMLEVPSAVLLVEQLSRIVHFFSVGSNDLCQYTLAVDRGNARVAGLFGGMQPAFVRLLGLGAASASAAGRWLGLCGEFAGQLEILPLLVGLGIQELSMSAGRIPAVKHALSKLDSVECRQLAQQAQLCATEAEVAALLRAFSGSLNSLPLLDLELIRVNSDSCTKAEAIKELCDLLYINERTDSADEIEAAVWQREQTYSTGLGFGFAIPHCRTNALHADSLAVLKLQTPLDWDAVDGKQIRLVLLLATREDESSNQHLKTFAKLSRKLMDEGFRQALLTADDAENVMGLLTRELDLI